MGDFFKGWRRKAGLVTLAMACVLTVAWMRSYVIQDTVLFPSQDGLPGIESCSGSLDWFRWSTGGPQSSIEWSSEGAQFEYDFWNQFDIEWRFDLVGVIFGEGTEKDAPSTRLAFWIIPYWSLVLPLTLLSAWLILGKTRKAKDGR